MLLMLLKHGRQVKASISRAALGHIPCLPVQAQQPLNVLPRIDADALRQSTGAVSPSERLPVGAAAIPRAGMIARPAEKEDLLFHRRADRGLVVLGMRRYARVLCVVSDGFGIGAGFILFRVLRGRGGHRWPLQDARPDHPPAAVGLAGTFQLANLWSRHGVNVKHLHMRVHGFGA